MERNNEHSPSALGHAEELSVENPVGPPVPEVCQPTEEDPKVAAGMRGEEALNVLEEDGGRSVPLHKVEEGVGEPAARAGEPSTLARDREVLTGEAPGPERGLAPAAGTRNGLVMRASLSLSEGEDVPELLDPGPVLGETGDGVGLDLGEGDGLPAGSLKPKVKASHS